MKRKNLKWLLAAEVCLLAVLVAAAVWLHFRQTETPVMADPTVHTTAAATAATETSAEASTAPSTEATTEETTEAPTTVPEPVPVSYYLTFAGDCTLGTMYEYYSATSSFPGVVGDDFDYPFSNVQEWFAGDDFTMVNLEGPLTNEGTPAEKTYCFRGDPKFASILPAGSVECVSLANNHSEDFGLIGYENTEKALDSVGVAYAGNGESILVETERGLKIGVFCVAFYVDKDDMAQEIAALRDRGAQVVIVSFHWGNEGYYSHTYDQSLYAYAAIDAGANIVFGHHPHVLQPIEEYNGGIIYYSLGNFAFGGNDCPKDFDTALIQQEVIVDVDGSVSLGECTAVPCSISTVERINNFRPTPAQEGSDRYIRVMEKLSGTYAGPDIAPTEATAETTEETTVDTTAETTAKTTAEPAPFPEDTTATTEVPE